MEKLTDFDSSQSSTWMYFQEEPKYGNEFCVYGEAHLEEGAKDESDAYAKIYKGRVSSGHGKWGPIKLKTGRVQLKHVLDVTDFAKKCKKFGKNQKIDQFLVSQVTDAEELGEGESVINLSATELYQRIKDYISENSNFNDQEESNEIIPIAIEPRCSKHLEDLNTFKKSHDQFLRLNGIDIDNRKNWTKEDFGLCRKLSKHFIMLWCCGAGKSTTPQLVYEYCIENLWDFREGFPINLVTSPTLKVLCGNLTTLAANTIAKNRQEKHICFTSGPCRDAKTLLHLMSLGVEVITDRSVFVDKMKEYSNSYTVWVHTTYQSYYYRNNKFESKSCLTYLMRKLGRDFYFAYIDEVHDTWQPSRKPFSAVHYDDICRIENRFKCTASKKHFKGPNSRKYQKKWHTGKYNDVIFPRLTIKEAYKRGYIRKYKILDFLINQSILDTLIGTEDVVEVLYDKKNPQVSPTGYPDIVAPLSYYLSILTQIYIRYAAVAPVTHTLAVVNKVQHGVLYKKLFEAVRPKIVEQLMKGDTSDSMYDRLMKIHCDVMDTHEESNSVKIFQRIDQIPLEHRDSIIIHCYVAEVGWNPGATLSRDQQKKFRGFVDSVTFIDRVNTADRIQQNSGRGARLSEFSKSFKDTCYLILNHLIDYDNEPNPYNKRFDYTRKACKALEIGNEELQQSITFFDYDNLGGSSGGGTTKGTRYSTPMFTIGDISGVDDQWLSYCENDSYSPLFNTTSQIIDDYEKYCEINNWNSKYINEKDHRLRFASYIATKYNHHFNCTVEEMYRKVPSILRGNHYTVSVKDDYRLDEIREKLKTSTEEFLSKNRETLLTKFENYYNNFDINKSNAISVEGFISNGIEDFTKEVYDDLIPFCTINLLEGGVKQLGSGRGGNGIVATQSVKKLNPNYNLTRVFELLEIPSHDRYKIVLKNIKEKVDNRNKLIETTVKECAKNYLYDTKWLFREAVEKLPEIRRDIIASIGKPIIENMAEEIKIIKEQNIKRFEEFAIKSYQNISLEQWTKYCFENYDRYLLSWASVRDGLKSSKNPKILEIFAMNSTGPATGKKKAKMVHTPKGNFTRKDAAKQFNFDVSNVDNMIKKYPNDWYYIKES